LNVINKKLLYVKKRYLLGSNLFIIYRTRERDKAPTRQNANTTMRQNDKAPSR